MEDLKLSLKAGNEKKTFPLGAVTVGRELLVIAGPCSVESETQLLQAARAVKESGANVLRGGIFKARTSPYSFQGLGQEGLRYLMEAREETGLPFITEVVDTRDVETVAACADALQIGARNVQNYALLKEVGKAGLPVILKRGFGITLDEYLCSAEYIMHAGNSKVILCERGIRALETHTRFTFDINAVAVLKDISCLPVIVDPSHATGVARYVAPMAMAAIVAGADGLMVEVHNDAENAFSDQNQQLSFADFRDLMEKTRKLVPVVRSLEG